MLTADVGFHPYGSLDWDYKRFISKFPTYLLEHIFLEGNKAADNLANNVKRDYRYEALLCYL